MKKLVSLLFVLVFGCYKPVLGQWSESQKLIADTGVFNDVFGRTVDIDVDYAIVGASSEPEEPEKPSFIRNKTAPGCTQRHWKHRMEASEICLAFMFPSQVIMFWLDSQDLREPIRKPYLLIKSREPNG